MEAILLFLPILFVFFTGTLISWGIYLMIIMMFPARKYNKKNIKNMCLMAILIATIFLVGNLFIFTGFAAFHMPTILFFEIWYITFLYRITISPWNTPCHQLVNRFKRFKKPRNYSIIS